jgi:hypothetical protein
MDIVFAKEGDRPRRAHRFIHGVGLVQNLVAIGIDIDHRSGSSGRRYGRGLGHLSSPSQSVGGALLECENAAASILFCS